MVKLGNLPRSWTSKTVSQITQTAEAPSRMAVEVSPPSSVVIRPDYPRDLLAYARLVGVRFHLERGNLTWLDPDSEPCEGLDEALAEHREALAGLILAEANATSPLGVHYDHDSIIND